MIALLQVRNACTDRVDDSRALITEHDRHRNAGVRAVVRMQTAMAYTARDHLDANFAEPGLVKLKVEHLHLLFRLHEHWRFDQHGVPFDGWSL